MGSKQYPNTEKEIFSTYTIAEWLQRRDSGVKYFFFYYNIKQNNMKYLKTFLIILEKKFAYKSSKWRRNKEKYWNKLCKSHNIIFNSGI